MPEIGEIKKGIEIGKHAGTHFIWHKCIQCGKERWINASKPKLKEFTGLCTKCNGKLMRSKYKPTGTEHPRWRGGKKHSLGYVFVLLPPEDPYFSMCNRSQKNYLAEHRYVMARHLGRLLQSWETVHHINGETQDNRIENLELLPNSQHAGVTRMVKELNDLKLKLENCRFEVLKELTEGADIEITKRGTIAYTPSAAALIMERIGEALKSDRKPDEVTRNTAADPELGME